MAGGLVKYRHLSRKSSARKALLRSQVTALVMHEHIQTTYAKAKESQRLAEKLITLAKRNTVTSRKQVQGMLYVRCPPPGLSALSPFSRFVQPGAKLPETRTRRRKELAPNYQPLLRFPGLTRWILDPPRLTAPSIRRTCEPLQGPRRRLHARDPNRTCQHLRPG